MAIDLPCIFKVMTVQLMYHHNLMNCTKSILQQFNVNVASIFNEIRFSAIACHYCGKCSNFILACLVSDIIYVVLIVGNSPQNRCSLVA